MVIPDSNTLSDVRSWIQSQLDFLPEGERKAHSRILMEDILGLKGIIPSDSRFSEGEIVLLKKALLKIQSGVPIQYVTGKVHFYGLELRVKPGVLIPRPETEELVDLAVSKVQKSQTIVDFCSGSGCITLAIKSKFPDSRVIGIEKSPEAVTISKENAGHLSLEVEWREADIFNNEFSDLEQSVDLIVSNPPYIPMAEKAEMESHVIDYEPGDALFVPNDEPLVFYRRIAELSRRLLKESGKLLCEVHENHANQVVNLFSENGYRHIEIVQDMQGKDRIVCADV